MTNDTEIIVSYQLTQALDLFKIASLKLLFFFLEIEKYTFQAKLLLQKE